MGLYSQAEARTHRGTGRGRCEPRLRDLGGVAPGHAEAALTLSRGRADCDRLWAVPQVPACVQPQLRGPWVPTHRGSCWPSAPHCPLAAHRAAAHTGSPWPPSLEGQKPRRPPVPPRHHTREGSAPSGRLACPPGSPARLSGSRPLLPVQLLLGVPDGQHGLVQRLQPPRLLPAPRARALAAWGAPPATGPGHEGTRRGGENGG